MTAQHNPTPGLNPASLEFAEDFVQADEHLLRAREDSLIAGAPTPSNGVTSALRVLARVLDAHAVVEIGTGTGVSGLALLEGMNPAGVLTSIDSQADWQVDARRTFTAAGIAGNRQRLIAGLALDVLPKLRDGAYDLVFINGDKLEYGDYVGQALRLLRRGGLLVLNDALWENLVADPEDETDETLIIREALQSVQEASDLSALLLPVGQGLLVAVKS